MAVVGEGNQCVGMENKGLDDGLAQEEQEQREEKSSILQQEFEKMRRGREAALENLSTAVPATAGAATTAFEEVDVDDAAENAERNTSRSTFVEPHLPLRDELPCVVLIANKFLGNLNWLYFWLLHLTCKFDSTTSLSSLLEGRPVDALDDSGRTALHHAADQHSVRCIEFLLKRRAKMDIKSTKGLIALEIALQSERMQIISWSPADKITELLTFISDKDLTALKILARHTRDVAQVASRLIVHGNIVAFAALLIVTGETLINTAVLSTEEHGDGTLFDVIVKKAISAGERVQDGDMNRDGFPASDTRYNLRQTLLKELELFLRWYLDLDRNTSESRRRTPPTASVPSPLMRAAQAGDIDIVGVLIDHESDVNETDAGGNTALHWSLRATVSTRDIRLVLKLLRHGASITMGDRLGLTPVHIAAGQGHLQALQILLAVEPSAVHVTAETKETPLFSAVKGNHYDCVRLLLQHGASRQVLNLRKQRPIDVADTSDMRALLSLQESSGRLKDLNSMSSPSMSAAFDSDYVRYACDTEHLRLHSDTSQLLEYSDESLKLLVPGKTEMCRYFSLPGGCVRGDKCFYAHREEDLQGRSRTSSGEIKQGLVPFNTIIAPVRMVKRVSEDLSKKIFVGGLSPSVESDDLREFFEGKFGAVTDAIVIGSHAGDHVQSRGFGFVTFKHEESVVSAVQAHYVNLFGKKVEIKGAVPRSVLPTLENVKGGLELSRPSSAESSKFSDIDVSKVLDLSSLELLCQSAAKGDLQVQMMKYMGYEGENSALPFKLSLNEEPGGTQSAHDKSSASPRSMCNTSPGATWIIKFKQWLPKFLAEVSNRLKEGEWYPLSSLKGDFRATCGLELDHVAIGYHKLSDFVRSIPDSCRMKIVPVGRGPATHMVLLPPLPRLTPTLIVPAQASKSTRPTTCSSLVDAGRSYAAAACQLPAKSMTESCLQSRSLMPQASLTGSSTGQFESHHAYSNVPLTSSIRPRYEELRLSDNFLSHNHTTLNDGGVAHALRPSIPQDQHGTPGSLTQEADLSNLRDVLALMDNYDGQRSADRVASTQGTEYPITNSFNSIGPNLMAQSRGGLACAVSPESLLDSHQEEPKTPIHQVNLRPFSAFNHPFTGFLPQDCVSSNYSMWGKQLGQQMHKSQAIMNRNQQQPISVKTPDQIRSWDDSPQSILHPYGRSYSSLGIQEAPRSLFSPAGSSPGSTDGQAWGPLCVYCCERQSLWVAIPCHHYALCAECKDGLHKLNRSTANCPLCASHVERWIALH